MAARKFLKLNTTTGAPQEELTVETSAGAADAGKIPNVNPSGVLDPSVVNATVTSAGAGSAGKLVQLDGGGKLDATVLPSGVGPDAQTFTTTEAVSAGDYLNIWNSSGAKVRKADASNGRQAHCYAAASAASGASVVAMFEGTNAQVSGRTPGAIQFLSATTPGAASETAPTGSGQIVQILGVATGATTVSFEAETPITLA